MPFDPPIDPDVDEASNRATRKASRLLLSLVERTAGRGHKGYYDPVSPEAPAKSHRGRIAGQLTYSQWTSAEMLATDHAKAIATLFGHRHAPALLTVVRSTLECALRLAWLVDPSANHLTREARALTAALSQAHQRTNLSSMSGPKTEDITALIEQTDDLQVDLNKNGRPIGVNSERWPNASDLLDEANDYLGLDLDSEVPGLDEAYAVLSSTPHGSSWVATSLITKADSGDVWISSRELLAFSLDGVWYYSHAIERFCKTFGVLGPLKTFGVLGPLQQPWHKTLVQELTTMINQEPE